MIPLIGLGTFIGIELDRIESYEERMQLTEDTVFTALQIGYRHLDLAESYGNLSGIARALKRAFKSIAEGGLGLNRSELILTMKSNKCTINDLNKFSDELGCDYFDNYLLHHPYEYAFNSERILLNTWRLMAELPVTGKVLNIGVSNCSKPHIERLIAVCQKYNLPLPYCNEIESNIFFPNYEAIDICKLHSIHIIAYSPLGYQLSTFVTSEENIEPDSPLPRIAKRIGATQAQLILAWHMACGISVIPKSKNPHRLRENFNAIQFIELLTQEDINIVKAIPQWPTAATDTAETANQTGKALSWYIKQSAVKTLVSQSAIYANPPNNSLEVIENAKKVKEQSKLSTKK